MKGVYFIFISHVTIHILLIYIDVMEVVIVLMIHRIHHVLQKTEVCLKVLNLIIRVNKSQSAVKNISCDCKNRINVKKCNSNQEWNKY